MPLSTVLGAQSLVQPAVCTTATRPASPYTGQAIYDTTVSQVLVYNGTAFVGTGSSSRIRLHTHNGYGSSSTKIPRYTTTVVNSGTDITYADSATLGSTFTINTAGMYAISVGANTPVSNFSAIGITLNSAQLTTDVYNCTTADVLGVVYATPVASTTTNLFVSATFYFSINDVIRPHASGAVPNSPSNSFFLIAKVN